MNSDPITYYQKATLEVEDFHVLRNHVSCCQKVFHNLNYDFWMLKLVEDMVPEIKDRLKMIYSNI